MSPKQIRVTNKNSEFYGQRGTMYSKTEFMGRVVYHVILITGKKKDFSAEEITEISAD